MAKTYLNTIKYEIKAVFEIDGVVEKPDIVGAIFGQSEGLLGEDMDLKELQQAGKIGRIEITVNKNKGKTSGEIIIPSSLDQVKTSILAATIETVQKVGPCDTNIKILKILDTRKEKREQITDRAKQLLNRMQKYDGIESNEIANTIKNQIRTAKIINLNGLPAGPETQTSQEIIIVEGRADVLKLLSYGIKNAIAMNGSNIEKSLIDLCKRKKTTILIDGDRGGELNAKKLAALTKIDFVARAPDGKEVEELTQKEILMALKRKLEIKDYLKGKNYQTQTNYSHNKTNNYNNYNNYNQNYNNRPQRFDPRRNNYLSRSSRPINNFEQRSFDPFKGNYRKPTIETKIETILEKNKPLQDENKVKNTEKIETTKTDINNTIKKDFEKIKGSLKARFYDNKNKKIKDVKIKEMIASIENSRKKISTLLFDGIITKRLIETAEKNNIKTIIGARKSAAKSEKVILETM